MAWLDESPWSGWSLEGEEAKECGSGGRWCLTKRADVGGLTYDVSAEPPSRWGRCSLCCGRRQHSVWGPLSLSFQRKWGRGLGISIIISTWTRQSIHRAFSINPRTEVWAGSAMRPRVYMYLCSVRLQKTLLVSHSNRGLNLRAQSRSNWILSLDDLITATSRCR